MCAKSCERQRKEAEIRYGITIGQTSIICNTCKKHIIPGHHVCLKAIKSVPTQSCASTEPLATKVTSKRGGMPMKKPKKPKKGKGC